jgi:hypothetical protein
MDFIKWFLAEIKLVAMTITHSPKSWTMIGSLFTTVHGMKYDT